MAIYQSQYTGPQIDAGISTLLIKADEASASAASAASAAGASLNSANQSANSATNSLNSAAASLNSANAAAASAVSAVNAPGTSGTSTTSLTLGIGSISFTTQTGKTWVVGQTVTVAQTAAPTAAMYGVITAYTSGTGAMTVQVQSFTGSGTAAAWTIGLSGPVSGVEVSDIGTDPNQIPLNQYLGAMAYQSPESVRILGGIITAQIRRRAPVTKTAAFTVADNEHWIICNGTAAITVTLPSAATNAGREIMMKNIAAFAVNSAGSNVVPLAGGAAGTAILPATAGKWTTLVSDGTNWIIMQAA